VTVVISCGARKRAERSPAIDLYTGPYFRAMRRWAESVVSARHIYILSAKHGLLHSTTLVDPYDARLTRVTAEFVERVTRQAHVYGIAEEPVVAIGGRPYLLVCHAVWARVQTPFAGSLFEQIGALTRATRAA
jgi:hypothetical protein